MRLIVSVSNSLELLALLTKLFLLVPKKPSSKLVAISNNFHKNSTNKLWILNKLDASTYDN